MPIKKTFRNILVNGDGELEDYAYPVPKNSDIHGRMKDMLVSYDKEGLADIVPTEKEISDWLSSLSLRGGECAYCGRKISSPHVDHLVASANDDRRICRNTYRNYIPCCPDCNASKGKSDFRTWYSSMKERILSQGDLDEETYNRRLEVLGNASDNPDTYEIDEEYTDMGTMDKAMMSILTKAFSSRALERNLKMQSRNGMRLSDEMREKLAGCRQHTKLWKDIMKLLNRKYPDMLPGEIAGLADRVDRSMDTDDECRLF